MSSEILQFNRLLELDLPRKQSAFLWGPRKTGKTTYLKQHFPNSKIYDLLKSDVYFPLSESPYLLREEILSMDKKTLENPIIIDEVQTIPKLLDEVHWLIENSDAYFILCGSSARKLKKSKANMLGGRAWGFHFFPLVSKEVPNFDLLRALNNGLVPSHYLSKNPRKSIKTYVRDYLKEEIKEEGLVRSLPTFARFLDSLAYSNGELTNYSNIARDSAIDSKTVKEYYQILIDTLLGIYIFPFFRKNGRDTIRATPKFYFFDVGIGNYISGHSITELKGHEAGKAFEHFILMELMAYKGLNDLDFDVKFWRTTKNLEVDFILCEPKKTCVAIEVKISKRVDKKELAGLIAFMEENPNTKAYVVSMDQNPRKVVFDNGQEINILPYKIFLDKLWGREIYNF